MTKLNLKQEVRRIKSHRNSSPGLSASSCQSFVTVIKALTYVRFGFVNTKMAKVNMESFMMPPEQASERLMQCLKRKPVCYSTKKRFFS